MVLGSSVIESNNRVCERVEVSHLLFSDHTLVFCVDLQAQMVNLSWLLVWFEAFSDKEVNFEKNELIPICRFILSSVFSFFIAKVGKFKKIGS